MTTRPISKKDALSPPIQGKADGTLSVETKHTALSIAEWLEEKKGKDVAVLDVSPFSSVADVMIIVTTQGARHTQALADWLLEKYAENSLSYLGMEGYAEGLWILVDSNDILVHIFQEDSRKFYNLDGLWSQCRSLLTNETSPVNPKGLSTSSATTDASSEVSSSITSQISTEES